MKNNRGNIEILLLLCCLVGVAAFFSISLAFISALELQDKNDSDLSWFKETKEEMEGKKRKLEEQIKELEEEKEKLEEQIKEIEGLLSSDEKLSEAQKKRMEKELKKLKEKYNRIIREIEGLRNALANIPRSPHPQIREKRERELEILEKQLRDLEKKINEILKELSGLKVEQRKDSSEDEIEDLQDTLEALIERRENLRAEINELRVKIRVAGTERFRNPLYVDCQGDIYVFYPEGIAVPVAELREEIFKGHDIIVFFVRPDGFKSFHKAYNMARDMSIKLSHEPLGADENLDFLKE